MTDLGEVPTTARRARGMTQGELAEKVGVTQAALSRYENGLREPDEATLEQLAHSLGVTTRFVKHAGRVRGAVAVDAHMRRRATAPATIWKRLEARLNIFRMHASLLAEEIEIRADNRVPTFDPIDTTPAAAARMVRMQWNMPIGPVRNLVGWLEAAGCLIIEEPFGTPRVDGMSQWIGGQPVIYVNAAAPTDRKRLTLAHELGHLVLHSTEMVEEVARNRRTNLRQVLDAHRRHQTPIAQPSHRPTAGPEAQVGGLDGSAHRACISGGLAGVIQARPDVQDLRLGAGGERPNLSATSLPPERPSLAGAIAQALVDRGLSAQEIAGIAGFASPQDDDVFVVRKGGLRAL